MPPGSGLLDFECEVGIVIGRDGYIADAFRAEGLLPRAVDAASLPIWAPPGL